jgi:CheY-like chemotaxis protein
MSKKILIIDDEPDVITYLSTVLKSHDYDIRAINSAIDAMETVIEFRPDLICLDIMMPRETGISFYTHLKNNDAYKDIPVIIVSGAVPAEEFDIMDFVDDDSIPPPDSYIEKPINVEKFVQTVEKFLPSGATLNGHKK